MLGTDGSLPVKVYNPNNRTLANGGGLLSMRIDDVYYQVDMAALDPKADFELDPDPDMSDLLTQSPTDQVPGQRRRR